MAYSTNPNLPKARVAAMRLLVEAGVPASTVALHSGVRMSNHSHAKSPPKGELLAWLGMRDSVTFRDPGASR